VATDLGQPLVAVEVGAGCRHGDELLQVSCSSGNLNKY
jgi:hypothetical protein